MNNKHQKVFFGPKVIPNQSIEQFRATNNKKRFITLTYISIAILFLVHMEVNFAAILDFSLNLFISNVYF